MGGVGVCGVNAFLGVGWVDWIDCVCGVSVSGVGADIGCWVEAVGVGVGGVCIVAVIVDAGVAVGAIIDGG